MIFLVQWTSVALASSILTGTTGVRMSSACRTTERASRAWALSKLQQQQGGGGGGGRGGGGGEEEEGRGEGNLD